MTTDITGNITTTLDSLADLAAYDGHHLDTSSWFHIKQTRINTFADATDDHQ